MDLTCEERPSDSPFVERIWRSRSEEGGSFISAADAHWGIVITRWQGGYLLTVRGPETQATSAASLPDMEFVGVQFRLGTLMPQFTPRDVMNRHDVTLPNASSRSFWLDGSAWEFPTYENAEGFIERLVREGLLLHDPVVASVLTGTPVGMSLRTVQRRFLQATGLTHNDVHQIQRARRAAAMLRNGLSILDTVEAAGYYDQPHLTRFMKTYLGLTPAQFISQEAREPLSFLYKT